MKPRDDLTDYQKLRLAQLAAEIKRRGIVSRPAEEQAEHCCDWISNYVFTMNPDEGGKVPFILYPYQRDCVLHFFKAIAQRELSYYGEADEPGLLIEKTRQMGGTWLVCAIELWTTKFWSDFQALNMSRKEDKVDDGGENATVESLHGKILFMWKNLPEDQQFKLIFKHLRIINPANNCSLIGETANPDAGAGGTYKYGLWDETARTPNSWSIYTAWKQAVRMPIYLSTPKGKSNIFAWLRFKGKIQVVPFHWTLHPIKSIGKYRCEGGIIHPFHLNPCEGGEWRSPWYDHQCETMPPEDVAQEIDIDYERSVYGQAFPEFSAERHGREELEPETFGEWFISIDPGVGVAAMGLWQFVEFEDAIEARLLEVWEGRSATVDTYQEVAEAWSMIYTVPLERIQWIGDPAGYNRDVTDGKSVWGEMLARHSIRVNAPFWLKNVKDRVRKTRDFLAERPVDGPRVGRFYYRKEIGVFAERMEAAKWPTNSDGIVLRDTDLEHNQAEHVADMITYGLMYYISRQNAYMVSTQKFGDGPWTFFSGLGDRNF